MPSPRRKPAAVSLEVDLYERSRVRARSLGFPTWSAYIVQLIRNDLASGGGMNIVQDAPAVYCTAPLPPESNNTPP